MALRLKWLYDNRRLIGAIRCHDIPGMQRCFRTPMEPVGDWPERLVARFKEDFGDSL